MKSDKHIIVSETVIPGYESEDLELYLLSHPDLQIEKQERELTAYASIEWAIPSLIAAYVAKGYFDGFLNELGADHYDKFKNWFYRMNCKFKGIRTVKITASSSPEKLKESDGGPSNFFAAYFALPSGNRMKVFLPNCESEEQDNKALSELFDNLYKLYKKTDGKFGRKLKNITKGQSFEEIYAIFDNDDQEWKFYTLKMLIDLSRSK